MKSWAVMKCSFFERCNELSFLLWGDDLSLANHSLLTLTLQHHHTFVLQACSFNLVYLQPTRGIIMGDRSDLVCMLGVLPGRGGTSRSISYIIRSHLPFLFSSLFSLFSLVDDVRSFTNSRLSTWLGSGLQHCLHCSHWLYHWTPILEPFLYLVLLLYARSLTSIDKPLAQWVQYVAKKKQLTSMKKVGRQWQEQLITTCTNNGGIVDLYHFALLRSVGKGAFGKVRVVQHKAHKQLFALKYINKAKCIQMRAVDNIISERRLLEQIDYTFIVNLRYAFQDDENMFMVIDLMLGGDLRFHLDRMGPFPEDYVRFYAAEISCALNYLHRKNIIHRYVMLYWIMYVALTPMCP